MRLPPELFTYICSFLQHQRASRTLAALQTCSKGLYRIATPYLYHHLYFTPHALKCLVDVLFDTSQACDEAYFPKDHDKPGFMGELVKTDVHDVPCLHIPRSTWIRSLFSLTNFITIPKDDHSARTLLEIRYKLMLSHLESIARVSLAQPGARLFPNIKSVSKTLDSRSVSDFVDRACRPSEMIIECPATKSELDQYMKPSDDSVKNLHMPQADAQDLPGSGTVSLKISYIKAVCGETCKAPDHPLKDEDPPRHCRMEKYKERAEVLYRSGVIEGSERPEEWIIVKGNGIVKEGEAGVEKMMEELHRLIDDIPTARFDGIIERGETNSDGISDDKRAEFCRRGQAFLKALRVGKQKCRRFYEDSDSEEEYI